MLKGSVKAQNLFLLAASYFFYGWWDWRYLSLVLFCSITNYAAGLVLMRTDNQKQRKLALTTCCVVSLGVLGIFKYYNFFVDSFVDAFSLFGVSFQPHTLKLILPVGISFYTFHTLSYTIDVYRRHFEPTKDIVSLFLFVSIFPLAMAGPIERATNLLPQIYKRRTFDYDFATDGMRQILWGLFKKMALADNCAVIVNSIFERHHTQSGSVLLIGAFLFAFQIYGDFSGYSDMALGIGKLLGFKFLRNFNYPYIARDIAEFWRRWHISLTTWFRDYLYIPLGGSRGSKSKIVRNTFIIFLVSGFWHGANWTFIVWGAYHAFLFLPLILFGKNRKHTGSVAENRILPTIKETLQMGATFLLVTFGWIIFRAENISDFYSYATRMFSPTLFTIPRLENIPNFHLVIRLIGICLIAEWFSRTKQFGLELLKNAHTFVRWSAYAALITLIVFFAGKNETFIYFQF